jgi:hypothetical protein
MDTLAAPRKALLDSMSSSEIRKVIADAQPVIAAARERDARVIISTLAAEVAYCRDLLTNR